MTGKDVPGRGRVEPGAELLTMKEVQARLRLSRAETYRVARLMEHVQIGRRVLVTAAALERYIAAHTKQPAGPAWSPPVPEVRLRAPRASVFKPSAERPIVPRTKPRTT